jgi:hypothetical protein
MTQYFMDRKTITTNFTNVKIIDNTMMNQMNEE